MCTSKIIIKTHGSLSCGRRSRRATPVSILTGRKKTQFSHLRSSVLPWRNKTIFAVDTPSTFSTPHSKFERNLFKRSRDMRLQKLAQFLRFLFFFLFFFLFSHTYKNCYKTRTPYPIALKWGTLKRGIKAHLSTNFG